VKKLARWFEQLAAKHSHHLVADNSEIRNYLLRTYGRDSEFIPYGCNQFEHPDRICIRDYGVEPGTYGIIIARMEAENNIEMMLEGFFRSQKQTRLLVTGNTTTSYGKSMKRRFGGDSRITFTEGIYDLEVLNNLRHFSGFYLHGHSVGGTNPALLEAMASGAFIMAHGNEFNRSVLESNALYFNTSEELTDLFENQAHLSSERESFISGNFQKVNQQYNWNTVAAQYSALFKKVTGL
jgi:glycosyltransferase involved in cell wall biosynthesis